MQQVPSNLPEIIREAATSLLSVFALLVIVAGLVCGYFFRGSPDKVKVYVWTTIFIGVSMFGVAVLRQATTNQAKSPANSNQPAPAEGVAAATPLFGMPLSIDIKENSTLGEAIARAAKANDFVTGANDTTVKYYDCAPRFLNATVASGKVSGKNAQDIIEQLQHRLKDRRLGVSYTVESHEQSRVYEIKCAKK